MVIFFRENHRAVADWIPKKQLNDEIRFSVREVIFSEAFQTISGKYQKDFFDTPLREKNLCQEMARR